jgi:glycosyltransferase involved in cell wall biosynthesis
LLTFYPHVESRTQVIRHGFDALSGESSAAVPLHGKPYLLYVGMRWRGYKNFNGLLTAYARMNDVQERSDLVCVGGGAFSAEEQVLLNELGLAGRVHQREAGDSDLHSWYRHAQLFVYPSLYEGFGIPPLEAMAAGCPAVCMHTSSIPEVCGDAVEYAEPDRPESLQAAIRNVLFSDERAEALRIAGKERLKLFSWRECARQTSQVYNSLV